MSLQVLIADDDKMILFAHKRMVIKTGLSKEPLCFKNGRETLNHIHDNYTEKNVFLVLLDINMPELDGWEFLESIMELPYAASIYVVMITSSIDSTDREKAGQYKQVIDYIEKPLYLQTFNRISRLPEIAGLY